MTLIAAAISPELSLWSLDSVKGVSRYAGEGFWINESGNLDIVDFTMGATGQDVWALDADGVVYKHVPQPLEPAPANAAQVSEAPDGTVCAVTTAGNVIRRVNGTWVPMATNAGPIGRVAVGGADKIYARAGAGTFSSGPVLKWNGTQWNALDQTPFMLIAAAADGTLVAANQQGVYQYIGGAVVWKLLSAQPVMTDLACGRIDMIYAGSVPSGYWWDSGNWELIGQELQNVAAVGAASDGSVVAATTAKDVYRANGLGGWLKLPFSNAFFLSNASENQVWAATWGAQGGANFWPGYTWQRIEGPPMSSIAAGIDNSLYAVRTFNVGTPPTEGSLYRMGSDGSWTFLNQSAAQIAVGADGVLLRSLFYSPWPGTVLWRGNPETSDWQQLPTPGPGAPQGRLIDMSIAANGMMVVVDIQNSTWYWDGQSPAGWQSVGIQLSSVDFINANTLCGVTAARFVPPQVWIGTLPDAGETAVAPNRRGTRGGHQYGPTFAAPAAM